MGSKQANTGFMNFTAYEQAFLDILNDPEPKGFYSNPDYLNYTKLNWSRQQRWFKTGVLNSTLAKTIAEIGEPQLWTIITEPWCGDAAHTLPFMHMLSVLNPLITVEYQLRDSPPFLIEQYLTNGVSKSIPKLIIAGKNQKNLLVWGPRPLQCQLLFNQLIQDHVEMEQKKIALQKWYNEDKGESFQLELLALLTKIYEV
jgi:hypothetical protein